MCVHNSCRIDSVTEGANKKGGREGGGRGEGGGRSVHDHMYISESR